MIQVSNEYGTELRHEPTEEGWFELDVYTPTTTPWDCYGLRHHNELRHVLRDAGIECRLFCTHRRTLHPRGSGPMGRVRFGDDMQPSTYRTAIRPEDEGQARAAIAAHKEAVTQWLHHGGVMPEACRQ